VRPAFITGCKRPPGPLLGVVLFPFEEVHFRSKRYMFVTQQDERVRAGTRAENMAVVVDVAGRSQRRDVTAAHGTVIDQAQFGAIAFMANCVPALMVLTPRTGAIATQQWWEWAEAITPSGRWNSTRRGPRSGLISQLPPADSEGIFAISVPRYSLSAASSTKSCRTWSISRMSPERSSSS
jgi:hypothetical protein